MSLGFELGYEMEFDEQGAGEPERRGKAREDYEDTVSRLHGAALEAFEEEVSRGREQAKSDLWAESQW